jgi:hypothetical protein
VRPVGATVRPLSPQLANRQFRPPQDQSPSPAALDADDDEPDCSASDGAESFRCPTPGWTGTGHLGDTASDDPRQQQQHDHTTCNGPADSARTARPPAQMVRTAVLTSESRSALPWRGHMAYAGTGRARIRATSNSGRPGLRVYGLCSTCNSWRRTSFLCPSGFRPIIVEVRRVWRLVGGPQRGRVLDRRGVPRRDH